jgi:hypothetical protein
VDSPGGYYGGQIIAGTGVRVTVPNGTITLTASATNTIYLNRSGTIGVRVGPPQAADEMDVLYSAKGVARYTSNFTPVQGMYPTY